MQEQHQEWVGKNFPMSIGKPWDALLGIVEEVGELAHAELKLKQGIRGTQDELVDECRDAIGDLFVYMMSYCNAREWDMQQIVELTWDKVRRRDWTADPLKGGE